jgi:hypothetical protein
MVMLFQAKAKSVVKHRQIHSNNFTMMRYGLCLI